MEKYIHTPGPWLVNEDDYLVYHTTEEEDLCICDTQSEGTAETNPDTAIANARLIAAAPDLLEALKASLETLVHISEHDPHFSEQGYGAEVMPVVISQARAAIAKAKG